LYVEFVVQEAEVGTDAEALYEFDFNLRPRGIWSGICILTYNCFCRCSSVYFVECEDIKMSLTACEYIYFSRGGVKRRSTAIGVAMGYKVVASNPGLDSHPFLRSWIAEHHSPGCWKTCNNALGSPCFGHKRSTLACLRH